VNRRAVRTPIGATNAFTILRMKGSWFAANARARRARRPHLGELRHVGVAKDQADVAMDDQAGLPSTT
jgi:hypothetical protein